MGNAQPKRAETPGLGTGEVLDIRRHLQNLELQVQQLRQSLNAEPASSIADEQSSGRISYREVRSIVESRRARDHYFDRNLFGEPAWDMLLELYACELGQLRMTASQLCVAAAVPATTALRWIGNLDRAGLIQRTDDPLDRRRVFVSLTDNGLKALRSYFGEVLKNNVNISRAS